jgi:hypothetical protein
MSSPDTSLEDRSADLCYGKVRSEVPRVLDLQGAERLSKENGLRGVETAPRKERNHILEAVDLKRQKRPTRASAPRDLPHLIGLLGGVRVG